MKKVFYLIMVMCLLSCEKQKPTSPNDKPTEVRNYDVPYNKVVEFKYKEHDYIGFYTEEYGYQMALCNGGIVHNPECEKCNGDKDGMD